MVATDQSGSVVVGSENFVNMRAFVTAYFVNLDIRAKKIKAGIVRFGDTAEVTLELTDNKVDALVGILNHAGNLCQWVGVGVAEDGSWSMAEVGGGGGGEGGSNIGVLPLRQSESLGCLHHAQCTLDESLLINA